MCPENEAYLTLQPRIPINISPLQDEQVHVPTVYVVFSFFIAIQILRWVMVAMVFMVKTWDFEK